MMNIELLCRNVIIKPLIIIIIIIIIVNYIIIWLNAI